ncbi:SpoIIE family protein phosphatase [bacterium]|nr:SpoIIE family protein phosphatase [bacterium]
MKTNFNFNVILTELNDITENISEKIYDKIVSFIYDNYLSRHGAAIFLELAEEKMIVRKAAIINGKRLNEKIIQTSTLKSKILINIHQNNEKMLRLTNDDLKCLKLKSLEKFQNKFLFPLVAEGNKYFGYIMVFSDYEINVNEYKQLFQVISIYFDKDYYRRQLNTIASTSKLLRIMKDESKFYNEIIRIAADALKVERVSFFLRDEEENMTLVAAKGLPEHLLNKLVVKDGEGITGYVAKTAKPLLVANVNKDTRFGKKGKNDRKKNYKTTSLLSVPVLFDGKVKGVLNVNNKISNSLFSKLDQEVLELLGTYVSIGVENKDLYHEIQEKEQDIEEGFEAMTKLYDQVYVLTELSKSMKAVFNITELTSTIMGTIAEYIPAVNKGIFLKIVDDVPRIVNSLDMTPEEKMEIKYIDYSDDIFVIGYCLKNSKCLMGADFRNNEIKDVNTGYLRKYEDFIVVPLESNKVVIGAIILLSENGEFEETDRNLLTIISYQSSVLLDNEKLYSEAIIKKSFERDLELASVIQQRLLPDKFPHTNKVDIFAKSLPAKQVGGDYFDVVPIFDDKGKISNLFCAIGDVAGKGVSAALIMTMTRSILRAVVKNETIPANVLEQMNYLLKEDIKDIKDVNISLYVTMVLGNLDLASGKFDYAKAGHNPPLLYKYSEDKLKILPGRGLFLGIFDDGMYQNKSFNFEAGDKLIFYTDGLVEAMNSEKEEFGLDAVKEIIKGCRDYDSFSLLNLLYEKVDEYVNGVPQHDDITVLVVQLTQPSDLHVETVTKVENLGIVLDSIIKRLVISEKFDEDTIFSIKVAIDEAICNAFEHGNKYKKNKKVKINLSFLDDCIRIGFEDEGPGFNYDNIPDAISEVNIFAPHGRGIILMKALMDNIFFNDEGNIIYLEKKYNT